MINRRTTLKLLGGAGAMTVLGAPAILRAQSQELVFGTYGAASSKVIGESFAAGFTKATGVAVKFADMPNPSAALVAAKGSGSIDLALCTYVDVPLLVEEDVLEAIEPTDLPRFEQLPERYRLQDRNGKVVGVGSYMGWQGVAFNKNGAEASDFGSWKNLADPKWKDKLAINRPQWGAAYDLTIFSRVFGKDESDVTEAIELYRQVAQNAITSYTSTAQMNQLLSRGEIAAGPYYSHRVLQMKQEGNEDVDFVIPSEGALSLPFAFVAAKGTKNREAVIEFLKYSMTAEPYEIATRLSLSLPVDPTIPIPADFEKLLGEPASEIASKIYAPDWNVVYRHWRERTAICEQIFAQK